MGDVVDIIARTLDELGWKQAANTCETLTFAKVFEHTLEVNGLVIVRKPATVNHNIPQDAD